MSRHIELCGPFEAVDRKGLFWQIKSVSIEKEGYIPDVTIHMADEYDSYLVDDEVFIEGVMGKLRGLGYEGESFGRAELGMQSKTRIVLEPCKAFRVFVTKKFGWQDLNLIDAIGWQAPSMKEESPPNRTTLDVTFTFRLKRADGTPLDLSGRWLSQQTDAVETALHDKAPKIPGWSFIDHYEIECSNYELYQLELNTPHGYPEDAVPWMEIQVPISFPKSDFSPVEAKKLADQLLPIVQEACEAGISAKLQEVSIYEKMEFSRKGVAFRAAPESSP